jgi:hypothetical protein
MSDRLAEVLKNARALPPAEQMELIARLRDPNGRVSRATATSVRWCDLRGAAAPSLVGKDAQSWINRQRQEADHGRRVGLV